MLTIKQETERLQSLLNGETVEGLQLGDAGLDREWVKRRIENLRILQPSLDDLVEDIIDITREQSHVDAVIIIRDRIEKDVIKQYQQLITRLTEALAGLSDDGCYDACFLRWMKKYKDSDGFEHSEACQNAKLTIAAVAKERAL